MGDSFFAFRQPLFAVTASCHSNQIPSANPAPTLSTTIDDFCLSCQVCHSLTAFVLPPFHPPSSQPLCHLVSSNIQGCHQGPRTVRTDCTLPLSHKPRPCPTTQQPHCCHTATSVIYIHDITMLASMVLTPHTEPHCTALHFAPYCLRAHCIMLCLLI